MEVGVALVVGFFSINLAAGADEVVGIGDGDEVEVAEVEVLEGCAAEDVLSSPTSTYFPDCMPA